jgi:hypothetical protein
VDGLDELQSCVFTAMCAFFKMAKAKPSTKFLVTSRPHVLKLAELFTAGSEGLSIQVQAREKDIRALVKSRIKTDEHLQAVIDSDTTWAGRVAAEIVSKSSGQ